MRVTAEILNETPGTSRATETKALVDATNMAATATPAAARRFFRVREQARGITCTPDAEAIQPYYAPRGTDVHATARQDVGEPSLAACGKYLRERPEVPIAPRRVASNRGAEVSGEGRMRRVTLAVLLLLHGFAHASVGVWAAAEGPLWLVTFLWATAMLGYFAASLGLFRVPVLRRHWKPLLTAATAASILMLTVYSQRVGLIGAFVDVALYMFAVEGVDERAEADIEVVESAG